MPSTAPRPPYQLRIGQWIVNAEARRDSKGRLAIYKLPKADGGGTYEIAGIDAEAEGAGVFEAHAGHDASQS